MKNICKSRILVGLFGLLLCLTQPVFAQQKIIFYTENYPPANFVQNGELKGISVDSLKLMWQKMGLPEQEIIMAPWARAYRNTLQTPNSALFTVSRTPARESLFKWVGPLFSSVHVLMAKKKNNFKFNNLGDVFNYRVATIRGDISEISLQQIGYPDVNMAKVTDLATAFKMVHSGRVDMMMVSVHGFQYLSQQLNFDPSKYEQVWKVNEIGNYIAFNKDTPDELINHYQRVFDDLEIPRRIIKQQYQLPLIEY